MIKSKKLYARALYLVFALALVAGLTLAPAVGASPDVSDVWVQLDDYVADHTGVTYNVYFTPTVDLAESVDTITVFFPVGTDPSGATVEVDADGDAVVETAEAAESEAAGYRLVVTTPVDISAGSEVRLDIPDVTNPSPGEATAYTLKVYTSQETTQVESSTYTIGADSVTSVDFYSTPPAPATAGAAAAYHIVFTENTPGELDVWDTVTVIFPPGTDIPTSIPPSTVEMTSSVSGTDPLDVAPAVDGRFVTLTVPEDWDPTATTVIVDFSDIAGITNPTVADDEGGDDINLHPGDYIGKGYTSDEVGIVSDTTRYDITADSISQIAFDAEDSAPEVMVSTATVERAADLIIQTKDQYGNLKNLPTGVDLDIDLSSTSGTGQFRDDLDDSGDYGQAGEGWTSTDPIARIPGEEHSTSAGTSAPLQYKDTTVGPATITAENAAHGWSDTWEIEVTPETVVELWDGDTLVGTYATISEAVSLAMTENVIKVGPGTYTPASKLAISQEGLTLESTDGATETIIDSTVDALIHIKADDVTFDGFTLDHTDAAGSAMWIQQGADRATVQNNIITGSGCAAIVLQAETVLGAVVDEATISGNIIEDCGAGIQLLEGAKNCMISNNTVTGSVWTFDGAISIEDNNDGNTITGNTLTDNLGSGIMFWGYYSGDSDNNLIESNTISGNSKYGIWVLETNNAVTNLVITGNDITDNEGVGIVVGSWNNAATTSAIKFNDISGNDADNHGYGLTNDSGGDVDATHNWWGTAAGSEIASMIGGSDDVSVDPWLLTTVSAGEFATSAVSLNAQVTVGVRVSGAANAKICAARYTENPVATPTFTPLENGFFDVYVLDAEDPTEIGIKFYDAAITSDSVVYVWDAFEEVWKECSDQAYNASYGYIWVKVRQAGIDVPTVPTISDLTGTPFAISTEAAPPPPPGKGDFDGDNDIDLADFLHFAEAYGSVSTDPNYNVIGDFDDNGEIDILDFLQFADVYGTSW